MAQTAAAKSRIHGQNAQPPCCLPTPRAAHQPTKPRTKPRQGTQTATPASACYVQGVTARTHASRAAPPRQSLQRTWQRNANPSHKRATPSVHQTAPCRATAALAARHNTRRRRIAQLCHARRATVARLPPRRTRETSDAPRRARWQRRAAAHLKLRQKWTFEIPKEVARLRCL